MEKGWGEVHSPYTRLKKHPPRLWLLTVEGRGVSLLISRQSAVVRSQYRQL